MNDKTHFKRLEKLCSVLGTVYVCLSVYLSETVINKSTVHCTPGTICFLTIANKEHGPISFRVDDCVACLTAAWQVQWSNVTAGDSHYYDSCCFRISLQTLHSGHSLLYIQVQSWLSFQLLCLFKTSTFLFLELLCQKLTDINDLVHEMLRKVDIKYNLYRVRQ